MQTSITILLSLINNQHNLTLQLTFSFTLRRIEKTIISPKIITIKANNIAVFIGLTGEIYLTQ